MSEIISSADFEASVLKADKPVLVDFFATWCGPCKRLAPVLDEIAQEVKESAYVYKVDIDQSPELAAQYRVNSVPTLIMFKGGQPTAKTVGAQPKAALMQMFK
jgi:thioredoxin 1